MTPAQPNGAAATPDTVHPRPQRRRRRWCDLSGQWGFQYDDEYRGRRERWFSAPRTDATITVPFPPESPASGIGDPLPHPILWYSRSFTREELLEAGADEQGSKLILHFGAVDYRATVWMNGRLVGEHVGGHTPFCFDVTDEVDPAGENLLVVRAEDQAGDVAQPRGKQDWLDRPHDIWYERTSGIWQPVWIEAVPETHIIDLSWEASDACDRVTLRADLDHAPADGATATVDLSFEGRPLTRQSVTFDGRSLSIVLSLRGQLNGQHYDKLLWSPERPRLIDAKLTVESADGTDEVLSYLGLRTVAVRDRQFLLNDRPYYVRAVLEQGYWPQSHLAAPSAEALRAEVELIKSLGFNAVRVHQKVEDPRFLYWADRLGLLVWAEMPSTYEFTPEAVERLTTEWLAVVRRDRSHPCVVTWVPLNESWGVQHLSADAAQRAFSRAISDLTRSLDPTRPVISNDGWEHTESDILTVHDYSQSGAELQARYTSAEAVAELFAGYGPAGRLMMAEGQADPAAPVMVSEFGGVRYDVTEQGDAWGYATATSAKDLEERLQEIFDALHAGPVLAGFCYTQLTDTRQEANGLTDEHRRPKLPVDTIRRIVEGTDER
ncbi:glycoside hydrolase family 2 protein [Nonomuraea jabiensis]|uniref:glycoside hydrolase family 2 protein n=1 Tax=Nonomuraea jabiensis TaxID=882448 RepID=UPI00369BA1B9